jgi:very-short-patch-repair endonuclease
MRGVERSETALNVAEFRAAREHHAMTSDIPRPILLRFSREQRANLVQAEAFIWRAVRDRRCEGAKFRRQAGIGNFIVDFVCYERRLIVEIDGPSHEDAEQQARDRERDLWLGEQGFRILRLPNELVIASTELAVARIRTALSR